MRNRNIIIIGGGGHSKACIDVISTIPEWKIFGYLDKEQTLDKSYGIEYLGSDDNASKYLDVAQFLIGIGQIKNSNIRSKIFGDLSILNAAFATVISAHSIVSKRTKIGDGTIIMHGVIVQADTEIGMNCIVNDRVLIEHDSTVGNNCHISTGAIINGGVKIGDGVFIGSGAVLRNGISIGDNCIIGMGAVVTKSLENGLTIYGNPAN